MDENILSKLAEPFAPKYIEWKPGTAKDNKCLALAYADLRAYQERLDEVCGVEWSCRYVPWGNNRIICELTIFGVTRSSTGEMDAQDEKNNMGGTVSEAQSFKRACAMWGLGRALYELPSVWVEYDTQRKRISDSGQAELDNRYKAWYQKAIAAQQKSAQEATTAPKSNEHSANPIASQSASVQATREDSTHRYADLIDRLTGDCLARANRARQLHAQSRGPASVEQYRFLAGTIDNIVDVAKAHNAILEVFVGRTVDSHNPPGIGLASKMLNALLKERTVERDGEKVTEDNPEYDEAAVNCIRVVHNIIREADGQASLFEVEAVAN